jgi:hypothetical protein
VNDIYPDGLTTERDHVDHDRSVKLTVEWMKPGSL